MSGSRIPPSAFPYRSRCTVLNSGVVAIGFPDGGGTPWVIHLRSATSAASSSSNTPMLSGWVAPFDTTPNTHWGAVSCGFSRRIAPASYRPSCRSMCAAPGQLPGAQMGVVGLPGRCHPQLLDVAFGVELDERGGVVGADQGRERRERDQAAADRGGEGRPGRCRGTRRRRG